MSICDVLKQQSKDISAQITGLNKNAPDYAKTLMLLSKELSATHDELVANGCLQAPHPPPVPAIEILIVMDGNGSFITGPKTDFSLGEVVATLEANQVPKFHLTRAHRTADGNDAAIELPGFTFDTLDLSKFDEIWLFGIDGPQNKRGTNPQAISDKESAAIRDFMEGGGGVFATGDHEDLGAYMSGNIPRVRSMRKWFVKPDLKQGWPEAPTGYEGVLGMRQPKGAVPLQRLDTIQPDISQNFYFENQSDTTPQPLTLIKTFGFGQAHPLMISTTKATSDPQNHDLKYSEINQFPDHMHEGEVIVPWDPNTPYLVDNAPFVEYPDLGHGQPLPVIVAKGHVIGGHKTTIEGESTTIGAVNDYVLTVDATFGVVGAYDGHYVNRGRVVVDSTWHHWFDVNLIGDPGGVGLKKLGFLADADGKKVLAEIDAYFINVALWLARPNTKWDWLSHSMWELLGLQPFNEILRSPPTELASAGLLELGRMVRPLLARRLPEAQVQDWLHVWAQTKPFALALPPHPWNPLPSARERMALNEAVSQDEIVEAALGGALLAVAQKFSSHARDSELPLGELRGAVEQGIESGLVALGERLGKRARAMTTVADGLAGPGRRGGEVGEQGKRPRGSRAERSD